MYAQVSRTLAGLAISSNSRRALLPQRDEANEPWRPGIPDEYRTFAKASRAKSAASSKS
jgi:hypothetical protein